MDWGEEQRREFIIVAKRCMQEHAASFCLVAVVLKTSHFINKQEEKLPQEPRGRGLAL